MSHANPGSDSVRLELPQRKLSRRQFLYTTAAAASSLAISGCAISRPYGKIKSPNELLDVSIIGCSGKGSVDSNGLKSENIVALCDVDSGSLDSAAAKWPKAKKYRDYREMLEKEKGIDATTVTIPDHQHASAAIMAMKLGKHVYCQKPLTHTIYEARQMAKIAKEYKVCTQMGNQGHSSRDIRELIAMIWSGAIGQVREVHCWTNRPIWPQGRTRPKGSDPVPSTLDWNLWLGPAPERPFKQYWTEAEATAATEAAAAAAAAPASGNGRRRRPANGIYHPFNWRGWWDFGCGALGDMACHVMDGANWALDLTAPSTVELVGSSEKTPDMAPNWSILKYTYPARGDKPPCTLTWYDGGKKPEKPKEMEGDWGASGTIFIGDKGKIRCGEYCDKPRLLPESDMVDYKKPPIPDSIRPVKGDDPYQDFIQACKGGTPACSNFGVSGPFTEMVLLGNLALRVGKKLEWDHVNMRVTNVPEANEFIRAKYRHGWKV